MHGMRPEFLSRTRLLLWSHVPKLYRFLVPLPFFGHVPPLGNRTEYTCVDGDPLRCSCACVYLCFPSFTFVVDTHER